MDNKTNNRLTRTEAAEMFLEINSEGVTLQDQKRGEDINKLQINNITDRFQTNENKWCEHTQRMEENHISEF
jgi:hypothetical protein